MRTIGRGARRRRRCRRPRLPAGLYWAPGTLEGRDVVMAIAPDGEMRIEPIPEDSTGDAQISELEGWLRSYGVTADVDRPLLFVV